MITNAAAGNPNIEPLAYVEAVAPDVGEHNGSLSGSDSALKQKSDNELVDKFQYPGAPPGAVDLYLLPGADTVDTHAVVAALPEHTSGSDLREIVRRAVLSGGDDGAVTTASLLAEVGSGRYRASVPTGIGPYL